jgi:hypothetical protein
MRYPNIVGIILGSKNADKPTVIPAEACVILPGQLYKKKIPEELYGKSALAFATMKPSERIGTIQRGIGPGGNITTNGIDKGGLQPPVSCLLQILGWWDTPVELNIAGERIRLI